MKKYLFIQSSFFVFIALLLILACSCGNTKMESNNNSESGNDSINKNKITETPIVVIKNKDSVVDMDGNFYHTVTIGNQTWMTENLKVTKYANGEKISNVSEYEKWSELTTGAYCNYLNKIPNAHIYGRLYNWFAVSDKRNIAPKGWRVATENDWMTLINYLAGEMVAGGKLKDSTTTHWKFPNTGATNISGFNALPSGIRSSNGEFGSLNKSCSWWANTLADEKNAIGYFLDYSDAKVVRNDNLKTFGLSVRCIKE